VKPHLGHLMAVLEIDQGRVGKLAAVGYEAEIGQPAEVRSLRRDARALPEKAAEDHLVEVVVAAHELCVQWCPPARRAARGVERAHEGDAQHTCGQSLARTSPSSSMTTPS